MTAKTIARPVEGKLIPAEPEIQPGIPQWTFVKRNSVGETLRFKDGSKYQFRKIPCKQGILSSSHVTTTDEKLAKNLRSLAKTGNYGVVEVHPSN